MAANQRNKKGDDDSLEVKWREATLSRKEQRKREQLEEKATKKKMKQDEFVAKNSAAEVAARAHEISALAATDLVKVKMCQQRIDVANQILNNRSLLEGLDTPVKNELLRASGNTLVQMIKGTLNAPNNDDKKPAAVKQLTNVAPLPTGIPNQITTDGSPPREDLLVPLVVSTPMRPRVINMDDVMAEEAFLAEENARAEEMEADHEEKLRKQIREDNVSFDEEEDILDNQEVMESTQQAGEKADDDSSIGTEELRRRILDLSPSKQARVFAKNKTAL